MAYFTPETVRGYLLDHFAPERMVFVGVNVAHVELTKWVMRGWAWFGEDGVKVGNNFVKLAQFTRLIRVYSSYNMLRL